MFYILFYSEIGISLEVFRTYTTNSEVLISFSKKNYNISFFRSNILSYKRKRSIIIGRMTTGFFNQRPGHEMECIYNVFDCGIVIL